MKVREFEDLLQAMRAKEHAAVNAEQAAVVDSVGLHQRLQTALSENEKNVQVRACRVLTGALMVPCAPCMHARRETLGTRTHKHTTLTQIKTLQIYKQTLNTGRVNWCRNCGCCDQDVRS